jgi:hypothetical protein
MHTSLHDHLDQLSPSRLSLAAGFRLGLQVEAGRAARAPAPAARASTRS